MLQYLVQFNLRLHNTFKYYQQYIKIILLQYIILSIIIINLFQLQFIISHEIPSKFIEKYKLNRCLCDVFSADYMNKNKRRTRRTIKRLERWTSCMTVWCTHPSPTSGMLDSGDGQCLDSLTCSSTQNREMMYKTSGTLDELHHSVVRTSITNGGHAAVSYTHLDVYKRQTYTTTHSLHQSVCKVYIFTGYIIDQWGFHMGDAFWLSKCNWQHWAF